MPIATGLALGLAGLSAASAVGGAAISANAAGNAASGQENAANNAALVNQQDAAAALNFNEQQLNLAQQNSAPYRAVGQNALLANNDLMGLTPVNPYPINAGGNTAPQPTGGNPSNTATPGITNNPNSPSGPYPGAPLAPGTPASSNTPTTAPFTPNQPRPGTPNLPPRGITNPRLIGLAKGGPIPSNRLAQHYIVGEKGPEELTMMPNGAGWVTPNDQLPSRLAGIHRADGGLIVSATPQQGINAQGQPLTAGGGAGAQTGGLAANPPQQGYQPPSPYGAQAGNPLISGGNASPIQNVPYSQWSQQFQSPGGAPGQFNAPSGQPAGSFQAPTLQEAEQAPGYQFQLQQGENAILNNASALGTTGSGATGAALMQYGQGLAQQDYGNVFNQALSTNQQQQADYANRFNQGLSTNQQQQTDYSNAYNRALGQYQQNYNIFNQNQGTQFNRLADLSGMGQTATGQLNATGQNAANNASQVLTNSGAQIGQQLNNAAAAQASGYIGQGNAWGGAVNGLTNAASMPLYLQMLNQGGGGPTGGYQDPAGNTVYPPYGQ